MSAAPTRPPTRSVVRLETPADLAAAMRAPWQASDQQWAAITAPLSPAVVIAGAGSGKTTLMAARVVYLVLTGAVRPDQVLGLTFTTKAATELRGRIRQALTDAGALDDDDDGDDGEDVLEPTVATYNAYAAGLLTDHGLRIGHEPDTRVITDAARYQLGARVVDRYTGEISFLSDHPQTVIQNLLDLDGAMSEHLVGPDDVRRVDAEALAQFHAAADAERAGKNRVTYVREIEKAANAIERRSELLGLVAGYRRMKSDLGLMDFSDQIELGARLAQLQPEVGVAERERFKVVLLDEYQDTSVAQATMLSRIFGGGHAVTAVGDPNQAIYGWRGASVSNILGFAETFPARSASSGEQSVPTYPLTVNRRSDRRILAVANRLAGPLYDATTAVRPLEPKPEAAEGVVTTRVFETQHDELGWLADAVREVHGTREAERWSDIGVLTRDNAHAAEVFDSLTEAGVPVEIVGLAGLLRLPEIAEVVAVLHLLKDVTSNASLLTLLTGPRWAIGPRDLKVLGDRARELAGGRGRSAAPTSIDDHLVAIADGIDPAEIPCLDDALRDPGEAPYSAEALERFALLAAELRTLRSYVGEPLLDLVRRIVETTGVDVELASAVTPSAAARRDNLDLFVRAVADFQAVDGDVTLVALLAYLTAEEEESKGLEIVAPSAVDSVKLLTVHRAKGLEWGTVFLVGVCVGRFPSTQSRTLWTSSPAVLPAPLRGDAADLPQLRGYDKAALDVYRAETKKHEATEERRLGYVAMTRAAHRLSVTSFCWSPRATPFGPSDYQVEVRDQLAEWGEAVSDWLDGPAKGDPHPYADQDPSRPWPPTGVSAEVERRLTAAARVRAADPVADDEGLDMVESARVADWDDEVERLLVEARSERSPEIAVPLPRSLSATALLRLREDTDSFARELARPMPRPPSRAARFGTLFHAWVEGRFKQQPLLDPDDLPGRADAELNLPGIDDDADLDTVIEAFQAGPFADRVPHAVEASFALVLDGQVVRGRIDAIYEEDDGSFLVVDWKTNMAATADPLQLAIYRVAWAELKGVPLDRVRAAFHYVRTGKTFHPDDLPDRAGLEDVLSRGVGT